MPMSGTPKRTPTRPKLSLAVQYASKSVSKPARTQLRRWILAALARDANITLRMVDRAEGRALNRDFRGEDYATNVLTFVYDEANGALVGDMVLCAPVVASEAKTQRKILQDHYAHLVVHGTLHLQGFDHENDREANVMESREIKILSRMKISNPYL